MMQKEAIKKHYKSIIALLIVFVLLGLLYSYTDLFPNCGDCWLDNLKGEQAYIKSQLKYTNDRVYIAEDNYQVIDGTKKEFLLGVSNKLDKTLNLQIDIKEVYPQKNASVIKSGLFEYDYKPFVLEPNEIRLFPIEYYNNGFIGPIKFVAYIRNVDFPYGNPMNNYTHISIYMNVEP